jgi:hypothetical protein
MFMGRDFDLFRCSDAINGPMVISEDLKRCLLRYDYKDYPSIVAELKFLYKHYGDLVFMLLEKNQFVASEYMDIVWSYYDIEDLWARKKYFDKKACYVKSLMDNLVLVGLYEYYQDLEPFQELENVFDVFATIEDLDGDWSPIAWVDNAPVTRFHKRLFADGQDALGKVPNNFGCLGYNFTKKVGPVCMKDTCGLSLYRAAEFDFCAEGIMLGQKNVYLLDVATILENLREPLNKKSSIGEVKDIVRGIKGKYSSVELSSLDPEDVVYRLFTNIAKDKLYPLAGNQKISKELLNMFNKLEV